MAETVHEIASVAAKAAWHDSQNTEPLSGASGDVSKGEPFDAGNLDPESQEKLRRSMSGEETHDNNYTTSGGNSGSQKFEQSMGTGSAPGATFAGGNVTTTNMHGAPADKNVPSSTRDTGYGVDPDQSKDISGSQSNTGSNTHSSTLTSNKQSSSAHIPVSASAPVGSNSHSGSGAALGTSVLGAAAATGSGVPPTTRDAGYGIDPNQSREIGDQSTSQHLGTNTDTYDGSTRTPSNTVSSNQAGTPGAAIGDTAALTGSNVPATTRDTDHGVDPNQSSETGGQSTGDALRSDTHKSETTSSHSPNSPSQQINKAAHEHGAAGAAGAALGLTVGSTAATDSSVPSTTRDTRYGIDPANSDAPGFNTITPNSKLAEPSGTSRDFSGNNNSSGTRDISDNASTRALASNSNKDLPATGDSHRGENLEEEMADVDGPGPRPVADVAAEHGGDAGKAAADEESTTSGKKGLADATEEPKHDEVKAEGSGEKWVKTSGLAADGGDFDASKPGAGREADRIMEQKGIKTENDTHDSKDSKSHGHDGKDKPGLVERIKDKLHKH